MIRALACYVSAIHDAALIYGGVVCAFLLLVGVFS